MNPIKPEDLFAPEFTEKLEAIVTRLEQLLGSVTTRIGEVKNAASQLSATPIATNQAESTRKWASSVNQLHESYIKLLADYDVYKWDLEQVTKVQRDQNQVLKLQQQYIDSAEGSFNKLSAEYRLLKIAMNALSPENEKQARQLELLRSRTKELYDMMNKYQQSTGKYGMQVGDYSKALNGLNLSTQQILREMPTLANSTSQFFMAISNNVPIFLDNFKRAREELGSFSAALKGTLSALFSWQTVLLALLTVLPKIAKAIHDKKKAQEEANGATKEAFNREKELLHLEETIIKAEKQSVAQLQAIYAITQDVTRSEKERGEATNYLKNLYPEILNDYTQEEILAGNAKAAIDDLTNSLILQAQARGYLKEIEELSQKRAKAQIEQTRLQTQLEQQQLDLEKERARTAGGVGVMGGTAGAAMTTTFAGVGQLNQDITDTKDALSGVATELGEIEGAMKDVINLIPTEGLVELISGGKGGAGKDRAKAIGDIKDYTQQWFDALIEGTADGVAKESLEIAKQAYVIRATFEKEYAALQKQEEEAIAQGNKAAVQRIQEGMKVRREVYEQQMRNLPTIDFSQASEGEAADPLAEVRKRYAEATTALRKYSDTIQEGLDSNRRISAEELANWQEVIRKKIEAEADYQKAKKQLELQGMLDAKKISEQEYEDLLAIETAKIDAAAGKAMDRIGKGKGKKWNIWTALFGKDVKDETTGTITRVLGEDTKFALDQTIESYKSAISYVNEYIDALEKLAQQSVETATKEADMARMVLQSELEAKANGYANSVELARKEYNEKLALEKKAQAEAEKIQKMKLAMESAAQAANLVTATTSIIASYSSLPYIGQALAIAGIAAMWVTFLAAKARAAQVTKYGEGMSEYLNYGNSHSSGHDIDFGTDRNGRRRRVERGEVIGVINKRNVAKYGASKVTGIIDSLNRGDFEYKYGSAFGGALVTESANRADLSHLEGGVDELVKQGQYREEYQNGKRIIQYKNLRRVIQ